jgi:PAS domain S-box-containing protein
LFLRACEREDPKIKETALSRKDLEQAMGQLQAAQAELETERARYRDLFESAPEAYLVTDPAGRIIEANRAAERLLNKERSELLGTPLSDQLAGHEREPLEMMLARLEFLELISDWELDFRRDGAEFASAVTVSCTRTSDGRALSFRWLVRDITERRATEARMVSANIELERHVRERTADLEAVGRQKDEALARLEAVLDQIPAGIVIADAASRKVVAANEHAARLVQEVAGKVNALDTWLNLGFHPGGGPFRSEERPLMRALSSGEAVEGYEIEFHLLDGTRALYETSAAPVRNADGEVVGAVAAYWDLTVRVRHARVEREFVTNAAHELRTPLAALASAVEVLQSGAKNDPHQRERFLAHVEQQSERLQRLVQSLLLLARVQTLEEGAAREPIPVLSLLEGVAALEPSGRVRIETEFPPDAAVLTNRDLAEHALLNLVSNAVKYAPDSEIVLSGRSDDGFVALEVADTGPGMTPEQQKRAAERFYRGRLEPDGFGLGLSIAQQAAEALKGRLELESDDRGTRARLVLPSAPANG